jgi:hypothetical protein
VEIYSVGHVVSRRCEYAVDLLLVGYYVSEEWRKLAGAFTKLEITKVIALELATLIANLRHAASKVSLVSESAIPSSKAWSNWITESRETSYR